MYRVELDGQHIGETRLEKGDPPMGVATGRMSFCIDGSPYALFKKHCIKNKVEINCDEEDTGFLDTQNITGLRVYRADGLEIEGVPGASISGFTEDGYDITILGIPYPFYGEEFKELRYAYERQFKED